MINDFFVHLFNRDRLAMSGGLFEFYIPQEFRKVILPEKAAKVIEPFQKIIFRNEPSYDIYRGLQFLTLFKSSRMYDYVLEDDAREIYAKQNIYDKSLYVSQSDNEGVSIITDDRFDTEDGFLRKRLRIKIVDNNASVSDLDVPNTIGDILLRSDNSILIQEGSVKLVPLGDSLPPFFNVDLRREPKGIASVIEEIVSLPLKQTFALFRSVDYIVGEDNADRMRKYENGFKTVGDSISRFCFVLSAMSHITRTFSKND
jgi:hypothetical protein